MSNNEKTLYTTLSKTSSFAYECTKEGVFIDLPTSLLAFTVFGPGGIIAVKASLISATFYTGSCMLGKVMEDYYESPYGLMAGRAIGNAGKYLAVNSYLKHAARETANQGLLSISNKIANTVKKGDGVAKAATAINSCLTDIVKAQGIKPITTQMSHEVTKKCFGSIGGLTKTTVSKAVSNQGAVYEALKVAIDAAKPMQVGFTAFKGAVNGALYGAASKYLPLEQNIAAAMPIEAADSLLGEFSTKSGFTGVMVGAFLAYDVTKFVEYDGAINDVVGNTAEYLSNATSSLVNVVGNITSSLASVVVTDEL